MLLPQINELLQNIDTQRGLLTAQLAQLDESRATLERLRDQLSGALYTEGAHPSPAAMQSWHMLSITDGTEKLIQELGPLDTREIADQLTRRGIRTKSVNFIPTVYASLRESPRFVRLATEENGRGKWALATEHPSLAAAKRAAKREAAEPTLVRSRKRKGAK